MRSLGRVLTDFEQLTIEFILDGGSHHPVGRVIAVSGATDEQVNEEVGRVSASCFSLSIAIG